MAEAVALARRSDVVVAALGELNNMNGEGVSRSDITLGLPQVELLKALKATGKPVILILTAGRPLALTETEPLADAIHWTKRPGYVCPHCGKDALCTARQLGEG